MKLPSAKSVSRCGACAAWLGVALLAFGPDTEMAFAAGITNVVLGYSAWLVFAEQDRWERNGWGKF